MKNYVFGYARVSTEQQNLDRQLDALQKYGVDIVYNEKMTGSKSDRVARQVVELAPIQSQFFGSHSAALYATGS